MEKKKENKGTYNARLYEISKKIFAKQKSGYLDQQAQSIHNTLFPFYQQLIGQSPSENPITRYAMPIIDLTEVSDDKLQNLCEFYLDYIRTQDPESKVRNVKNNLTKINLTADTDLTDKAMRQAEKEQAICILHEKNNVEFYKKLYAYCQQTIRFNIKKWETLYRENNDLFSLKHFLIFRRSAFEKILSLQEYKETERGFSIWEDHYHTQLYTDISCWILLQTVTNLLTAKKFNAKFQITQKLCEKLDSVSLKVKPVKCSDNIFLTYSEFLLFAVFRTHFLEDIDLLKHLQETCTDTQNPPKEYSLINDDGTLKAIPKAMRASIYLEGNTKGKRAFNSNIKKCEEFIPLFNKESGRTLKLNDITLKAVYRQLILERTSQSKRQSKTILKEFLKNKSFYDNYADYYFINGKITMGMYREYGLLEEFFVKNEFHKKLYIIINTLLTNLRPDDIFREVQKFFNDIFLTLDEIFSEGNPSVSPEDIEGFLSTMVFHPLDEPIPVNNM